MSKAGLARRVQAAALASALAASLSIASSTVPALAGQQTFTSTGAEQQFTVPAGVVSLHLTLVGAPGATGSNVGGTGGAGANGARVTSDLAVSPGDTLFVEVGGAGSTASGGFNGGGSPAIVFNPAGGGGGATDIRTLARSNGTSLASRLIVAGGGGGGGAASAVTSGGAGGGGGSAPAGGTVGGSTSGATGGNGGGAGGASTGGTAGSGGSGTFPAPPGFAGSAGSGGAGSAGFSAGGGGGGGYFGGGGGGGGAFNFSFVAAGGGGGGAGSNFLTGTGVSNASASTDSTGTPEVVITYAVPAAVTSVSPSAGPTSGGASVTIKGTAFSGATAVNFGSVAATSFTVDSNTQITATSPAENAGTVDVTVTTPAGTSPAGPGDRFRFAARPVVTSLDPSFGPNAGGSQLTINGSGFTGATGVSFGTAQATSFRADSDSKITAVTPAGSGAVAVTVTTPGGSSDPAASPTFLFVEAATLPSPPATGRAPEAALPAG